MSTKKARPLPLLLYQKKQQRRFFQPTEKIYESHQEERNLKQNLILSAVIDCSIIYGVMRIRQNKSHPYDG